MKRTIVLGAITLGLLGFSPALTRTNGQMPPSGQLPAARGGVKTPQGKERHPHIRAAIRALRTAKRELESAQHDFAGHRVKAVEHVNQALEECRLALESDKEGSSQAPARAEGKLSPGPRGRHLAEAGKGVGAPQGKERHPEIRAAMRALQTAKRQLEAAQHDFAGHRVKAVEHVNQALEECRLALESDKG